MIGIRLATPRDARTLAAFNAAMALETEGKRLFPEVVGAGVRRLLGRPASGFYVVAHAGNAVVGCLMVTTEWSDWRNGSFWWIQSVYVHPEFRRRGVYKMLYRYIRALAAKRRSVCGFRLYVERHNRRARAAYRAAGMQQTAYVVFEQLKPAIRFYEPAVTPRRARRR
jgi:ribosomal protein S18 acetylase RimI-like enzyme